MAEYEIWACPKCEKVYSRTFLKRAPNGMLVWNTREGGKIHGQTCRHCANARQRKRRQETDNSLTRRYEKTKPGFLMRLYRNMKSRISGLQPAKHHLYAGKELLSKEDFYTWAFAHPVFHRLFDAYRRAGYPMRLAPSVDRIDAGRGYTLDNMEWVTHSENSRRGALSKTRKR